MKTIPILLTILLLYGVVVLSGCIQSPDSSQKTEGSLVDSIKSTSTQPQNILNSGLMFVGGEFNGNEHVGQSMVHTLGFDSADKSIVMVPGHGLSAYLYTSTPDGRNGWSADFANQGYNTYAIDTNNLAVSGMEIKDFGTANQPKLTVWGIDKIWKTWGFGDTPNQPYETTQYPVEHIEQLYASFSPMISKPSIANGTNTSGTAQTKPTGQNKETSTSTRGGANSADMLEVANIIELLEQTGPSVLMAHSMGGVTAFEVVRQRPDLVTALVVIEPVGSPTDESDLKENFLSVPYLAVYGDFIESRGQTGRYESCQTTAEIITANGGYGEVITLTDLGMEGNTHLMMQDKNSHEISELILKWLDEHTNE